MKDSLINFINSIDTLLKGDKLVSNWTKANLIQGVLIAFVVAMIVPVWDILRVKELGAYLVGVLALVKQVTELVVSMINAFDRKHLKRLFKISNLLLLASPIVFIYMDANIWTASFIVVSLSLSSSIINHLTRLLRDRKDFSAKVGDFKNGMDVVSSIIGIIAGLLVTMLISMGYTTEIFVIANTFFVFTLFAQYVYVERAYK